MSMKLRSAAFAMVALAFCGNAAMAAQLMETENFGPATPNYNQTLTFDKFDPLLGILNSIKVKMQIDITGGSLGVDNDGAGPASVDVELGAEGTLSSGDVTLLDITFLPVTGTVSASTMAHFDLGPENGDGPNNIDTTGPDGALMLGQPASDMAMGFINPIFFAGYIGTGQTFDIDADIDQILNTGSVGGVEGSFSPVTASGNVMVVYDYTPFVPEPSSAVLALLAMLGWAGFARRS
jgi:hypothetical protein